MIGLMLLMTLAASQPPSPAQAVAGQYNGGSALYSAKDYRGAIESYRGALAQADLPQVRFNLGNAYFKDGQLGMAVVQYRRARALAPRDRDIAFNLEFVRGFRVDKTPDRSGPLEEALAKAFTLFSGREASLLAAVCFLLAGLLASLGLVLERKWLLLAAALPLLCFGYFLSVTGAWRAERRSNPGAVTAKEVSALSGPGEDFKEILLLHDGSEVRIRESRGDHLLVQLSGGMGGWVPKGAVERIY